MLDNYTPGLSEDEKLSMACDWADYRSAYGIGEERIATVHLAFKAGWEAGRKCSLPMGAQ
jgi:hypothetical protein